MPPSFPQNLLETYLEDLCKKQKAEGFDRLKEEFFIALRYLRRKKPQYSHSFHEEEGALDLLHDCVAEILSNPQQAWPRGSILRLVGRKAYASFERKVLRTHSLDPKLLYAPREFSWAEPGNDPSLIQAVSEPGVRKGSGGIHFERLRLSMQQSAHEQKSRPPTRRGLRARLRALAHHLGRDPRYQNFWLCRLGEVLLCLAFRSLESEVEDLLPGSPSTQELQSRLERILLQMRQLPIDGVQGKGLRAARALHRHKDYSRPSLTAALENLPRPRFGALALRIEEARLSGEPDRALSWSPAPEDLHKIPNQSARQSLLLQRARLYEAMGNPDRAARLLESFLPLHQRSALFLYNLWVLSHMAGLPWIQCKARERLANLSPQILYRQSPILRIRVHRILHQRL